MVSLEMSFWVIGSYIYVCVLWEISQKKIRNRRTADKVELEVNAAKAGDNLESQLIKCIASSEPTAINTAEDTPIHTLITTSHPFYGAIYHEGCRKLWQFPPVAHSSSLASARSFNREVWCLSLWERESRRKITCVQSGSSRKYKSWGAGEQGGVLKCWKGPEKVKPREVCEACLLIFHIG